MVLEEVPEETRLWKPETAPQAMVTKGWGKGPVCYRKAFKSRHIDGGVTDKNTDNACQDHAKE